MKKINELSELEIFNLKDQQIDLMIKLRKAEEGIKMVAKPKEPSYFLIKDPDLTMYSCTLFGDNLVFEDIKEFQIILDAIKNANSKYAVIYDWNKADSSKKFATKELEKPYNGSWHTTASQKVYSIELYNEMIDMISQNKKMKEHFDKEYKTYTDCIGEAKWIEDEINEKVMEVKEKFWKLEDYCRKFKVDYLPLSNDNEDVAMNFIDKAYSLSDEQKKYVLENYKSI